MPYHLGEDDRFTQSLCPAAPTVAPPSGQSRPTIQPPQDAVVSDWKPRLPSDWETLPDLSIHGFGFFMASSR